MAETTPIPTGWECFRCKGSHEYCVDCGSIGCVCPEHSQGLRVLCEHDRGALRLIGILSNPVGSSSNSNGGSVPEIDPEAFNTAVWALAEEDGVENILGLPGVWEIVSEHYNNNAIRRVESEQEDEERRQHDEEEDDDDES